MKDVNLVSILLPVDFSNVSIHTRIDRPKRASCSKDLTCLFKDVIRSNVLVSRPVKAEIKTTAARK